MLLQPYAGPRDVEHTLLHGSGNQPQILYYTLNATPLRHHNQHDPFPMHTNKTQVPSPHRCRFPQHNIIRPRPMYTQALHFAHSPYPPFPFPTYFTCPKPIPTPTPAGPTRPLRAETKIRKLGYRNSWLTSTASIPRQAGAVQSASGGGYAGGPPAQQDVILETIAKVK
jgi:hypothetical protein